ncbi:hypothetical protein ACXDF8_06340 [Mycolicibacterium sp. CBM1]
MTDTATLAGPDADALHPRNRLASSQRKIRPPFALDPTMRFYSPQANVDALRHERVAEWLAYVQHDWEPMPMPGTRGRLGLLLPCTKYKPYATSREHRAVNSALLAAGWRPSRRYDGPAELLDVLDDGADPDVLNVAPLLRDGVVLDRFVISEPLVLVPYELTMTFRGAQSPATSYDDPGMFENRSSSVSPERHDCTATPHSDGTWTWGPAERQAYAEMHNAMADGLGVVLARIAPAYQTLLAWVSPGLTHRSFLADAAFRADDGLPTSRRGVRGAVKLRGALDAVPGVVDILPTREQIAQAKGELAERLHREGRRVEGHSIRAVYARGDGHDTPLGLPELTAALVARLAAEAARL